MNENTATMRQAKGRKSQGQSRSRSNVKGHTKKPSNGAANSNAKQPKNPKARNPSNDNQTPLQLNGALSLIKPIVELHRPRLAKAMADHSRAMLAIVQDIQERMESIRKFEVPTS
jgi:hypothetical protein